jgi:universal stress protein A
LTIDVALAGGQIDDTDCVLFLARLRRRGSLPPLAAEPAREHTRTVFSRILVPVDFSDCSRAALTHAVELATRLRVPLTVLHVWELPASVRPDMMVWLEKGDEQPIVAVVLEQARRDLDDFVAKVPVSPEIALETLLKEGGVVPTILEVAEQGGYDLVVMGTHGRSGLAELLTGSVTKRLLRHAPCAVLTVRPPEAKEEDYSP